MKSKSLVLIIALLFSLSCFSQVERPKSITERVYPKWFSDAKLGIFIHFGLYSVPSWSAPEQYAEWFYKGLISGDSARINFQKRVFGENFKYEEYKNIFKAELFDANEWANLFKRSGAKYVLFTSKHHDGYAMWNSAYSKGWNSYETAPKRDFCQELTDAVRAKGLEMGLYYSLTEWTNPLYRWTIDTNISIENYVSQHMHPQFKELVTKFRPSIIFSDGDWDHSAKAFGSDELVDWYYKTVGEKAIVNDRWGGGFNHGFITPEYSAGIIETSRPWAECRGIGRSFGLNRNESIESYKTSEEIIRHFVKLVAGGGGLTLNVGPSADGKIPLLQQERLLDLGNWLSINGEAIYGSKPFTKQYEQWDVNRVDKEGDFESTIDFDWVRNSPSVDIPEDNFSIIWTSKIKPSYEEEYTITCKADDYAKVYLDNRLIIDTRDKTNSKNIKLKKDKDYNIEVKYFETTHNASIRLSWKSLSQKEEPIKTVWGEEAFWKKPYLCYTTNNGNLYAIAYDIPDKEIVLNLDKAPKKDMKIIFLDNHKPMSWEYQKGKLKINTSSIHPSDLKSHSAYTFRLENYLKE